VEVKNIINPQKKFLIKFSKQNFFKGLKITKSILCLTSTYFN